MSPRLRFAIDAARAAGQTTLRYFQSGVTIEVKSDGTPVTVADQEAEATIRALIAREFPGEAVYGEEQGEEGSGELRWVIDPIDGTKSFVCGVPLYATLLSLERHGEPILGVCFLPALNEILYAETGHGAYWNDRRCAVSSTARLEEAALCCGAPTTLRRAGLGEATFALGERVRLLRSWTDAYGHVLVATGRVDAMIDPVVAPYDVSALQVIVREAGGQFTSVRGGSALSEGSALSSNGLIHDDLLGVLDT